MQRPGIGEREYQPATERKVLGIALDRLACSNPGQDIINSNAALEHSPQSVTAKNNLGALHTALLGTGRRRANVGARNSVFASAGPVIPRRTPTHTRSQRSATRP